MLGELGRKKPVLSPSASPAHLACLEMKNSKHSFLLSFTHTCLEHLLRAKQHRDADTARVRHHSFRSSFGGSCPWCHLHILSDSPGLFCPPWSIANSVFCWGGWEGKGEGKKHLLSKYHVPCAKLGTLYVTLCTLKLPSMVRIIISLLQMTRRS